MAAETVARAAPPTRPRSMLRGVAVPSEHGGWGLTAEPALLGLLVGPSIAGGALALAAMSAFVMRTPLRVVLVDVHRHRLLERTRLAGQVLACETIFLAALIGLAAAFAEQRFWWPAVVAGPLIAVELAFDMRSRSRRMAPELAGSVAVGAVAPMIALAGGASSAIATGAWLVMAARSVSSVPHVRAQIARLHGRRPSGAVLVVADLAAVTAAALAVAVEAAFLPGAIAVLVMAVVQRRDLRVPVPAAKVVGIRQMIIGVAIVACTAIGVRTL